MIHLIFIVEALEFFKQCIEDNPDISATVAAIKTLLEHLKVTNGEY